VSLYSTFIRDYVAWSVAKLTANSMNPRYNFSKYTQ